MLPNSLNQKPALPKSLYGIVHLKFSGEAGIQCKQMDTEQGEIWIITLSEKVIDKKLSQYS